MNILGVKIDCLSRQEALNKVSEFLASSGQSRIFTPNPEMLVDARKDEYFREVLNGGDLNICDGVGLVLASRGKLKKIAGVDFMLDICRLARERGQSVYLLGSGDGEVIKKAAENIKKQFPNLKIAGVSPGNQITMEQSDPSSSSSTSSGHCGASNGTMVAYDADKNQDLLYDIIMQAPDILFVGFGHGKQEKWIYENLAQMPSVKVAMGVGGAFDFLAGKVRRAPKFMRLLGLEWLWRLILEPWRVRRIFKATVVFLFYFLWQQEARR